MNADLIAKHSQILADRAAKLDSSINAFLGSMDQIQASLDKAAAEHEALRARVAELEAKLAAK